MDNYIFGALSEQKDVRDYKLSPDAVASVGAFPDSFELKPCAVKNQGTIGSCVAHALSEVVEYHDKIQNKSRKKASVGFVYGNRRNSSHKGAGMYVREALSNMVNFGDAYYTDFPENVEVPEAIDLFEERFEGLKELAYPHRFTTYVRLTSDDDIKYALMHYGPVVFSMNWYSDIKVDSSFVIHTEQKKSTSLGGHCMIIYGWDEEGWKIQNSWGSTWGNAGRAILPYDIKMREAWSVIDTIIDDDELKKPYATRFLKFLAKIINWFLNLFNRKKE